MRRLLAATFVILLGIIPDPALAQAQAPTPADPAAVAIDPTALGVSMSRINKRLAADARARSRGASPLNLQYFVDVYGTAPTLRFFAGESLVYGAVPGSAPTHRDMLDVMTPQIFRAPTVNFFGLAMGAAKAAGKKIDEWQYARELKRYQDMVEAGRKVPAPLPPK